MRDSRLGHGAVVRAAARGGARARAARRPHAHRVERPGRLLVQPRAADRVARADRRARVRLPDARARRLLRRRTTWSSRRPRPADGRLFPFCRLDPHGDALAEAERALGARRTRHQAAPARRAVHARPPGARRRSSRSPTSGGCRCSSTPAAASRRSAATPSRRTGRHPGMRLILAHAGHLRPGLDLARGGRPPEPVLRHLLVVAGGRAGAVRAGAARPGADGERRALRLTGVGGRHGRPATPSRSGSTPSRRAASRAARRSDS